jgi:hypothetical protein
MNGSIELNNEIIIYSRITGYICDRNRGRIFRKMYAMYVFVNERKFRVIRNELTAVVYLDIPRNTYVSADIQYMVILPITQVWEKTVDNGRGRGVLDAR